MYELSAFHLSRLYLSKNTDLYCFVRVLTHRSSADRGAAGVRVTATGLRCVRATRAVSQSLCGLGVWSAADRQGGEGHIHPPVCVRACVCFLMLATKMHMLQAKSEHFWDARTFSQLQRVV